MRKVLRASVGLAALGLLTLPVQAATLTFTIENKTGSVVEGFYASPVGTTDWEEDLLGDEVLMQGEKRQISFEDSRDVCKYDLLFKFAADASLEDVKDTKNLCELSTYTVYQ